MEENISRRPRMKQPLHRPTGLPASGPDGVKNETAVASMVAFTASFCILVIELVAGRIMAPHVGVSLYSWTSIIGVVLAGISLGAYAGGVLADRFPHRRTMGWLLLAAGLAAFTIAPLTDLAGGSGLLEGVTTLMVRILVLTAIVFFVPSLLLGMVSPVVIKLAVKDLEKTGHVVGKISAFSTLGSILGTFATGFYLIEAMGTRAILYSVGMILMLSAPVFGGWMSERSNGVRRTVVWTALLSLAGVLAWIWFNRDWIARPRFSIEVSLFVSLCFLNRRQRRERRSRGIVFDHSPCPDSSAFVRSEIAAGWQLAATGKLPVPPKYHFQKHTLRDKDHSVESQCVRRGGLIRESRLGRVAAHAAQRLPALQVRRNFNDVEPTGLALERKRESTVGHPRRLADGNRWKIENQRGQRTHHYAVRILHHDAIVSLIRVADRRESQHAIGRARKGGLIFQPLIRHRALADCFNRELHRAARQSGTIRRLNRDHRRPRPHDAQTKLRTRRLPEFVADRDAVTPGIRISYALQQQSRVGRA
jgi:hypothetical protein